LFFSFANGFTLFDFFFLFSCFHIFLSGIISLFHCGFAEMDSFSFLFILGRYPTQNQKDA